MKIVQREIELEISALEPIPLESGVVSPCYPYLPMRETRARSTRTFSCLGLSSGEVSVLVCPELGGRILELKLGEETFIELQKALTISPGGSRGVEVECGIQFVVGEYSRPLSLAEMDFQSHDETATVVLFERDRFHGVTTHIAISIPAESHQISIAIRVFNEQTHSKVLPVGLRFPEEVNNGIIRLKSGTGSMGVECIGGMELSFEGVTAVTNTILHPLDSHAWEFMLSLSSEPDPLVFGHGIVAHFSTEMRIGSAKNVSGNVKISHSEEHAAVQFSLSPGHGLSAPIPLEMNPIDRAFIKLDSGEVIQFPKIPTNAPLQDTLRASLLDEKDFSIQQLWQFASHRSYASFAQGDNFFEQAASENPGNFYAWVALAMHSRKQADEQTYDTAMAQAHYLCPLDPLLRMEAYLSARDADEEDPVGLLKPIESDPEAMVACASFLLELGYNEDAYHWIRACLKLRPEPMLTYFLAWLVSQQAGMEVDAMSQIQIVSEKPIGLPFPNHLVERRAVNFLSERFTDDQRLKNLVEILRNHPR